MQGRRRTCGDRAFGPVVMLSLFVTVNGARAVISTEISVGVRSPRSVGLTEFADDNDAKQDRSRIGGGRCVPRSCLRERRAGRLHRGLGGRGDLWTLEEIAGEAVPDGVEVTLEYDGERIAGSGGCNQYSGEATFDDGTVTIAPELMSTMMACEDPAATVESQYLEALPRAPASSWRTGCFASPTATTNRC